MKDRSSEARKVLRELDAELAAASAGVGTNLVWTAADRQLLSLIGDSIDRHVDLAAHYAAADDVKSRVKLSAEMRLLEGSLARLLRQVHTDIPKNESQTTLKARRAARARWDRRNATGCRPGLRVPGCYDRLRANELRVALWNDPREGLGDRPLALAPTDRYSATALGQAHAALKREPLRVPRWYLGGRTIPEARRWPAYDSRAHDWFTVTADDVITPA
jgi:hypothetical protein